MILSKPDLGFYFLLDSGRKVLCSKNQSSTLIKGTASAGDNELTHKLKCVNCSSLLVEGVVHSFWCKVMFTLSQIII